MKRLVPFLVAIPLGGCVGITTQQKLMAAGSIVASSIDGAHAAYSRDLTARNAVCFPSLNPESEVETKKDLDDCLGPGFNRADREKIAILLKLYRLKAEALGVALQSSDEQTTLAAYQGVVDAARDLLKVLPAGSKLADKIRGQLEPWGF